MKRPFQFTYDPSGVGAVPIHFGTDI